MSNFNLKRVLVLGCLFLLSVPAYAQTPKSQSANPAELPVAIDTNTKLHTNAKIKFKCAINKTWLQRDVSDNAVSFHSPDEVFFINFSRNSLRAMYFNVPAKNRKLSWKDYLNQMQDKKVFQKISKDIALLSSQVIAKNAKIISAQDTTIAAKTGNLIKIEGLMPEKNMKFRSEVISFIDQEDVFTINIMAFSTGRAPSNLEKEFSSIEKQVLNTFEVVKK